MVLETMTTHMFAFLMCNSVVFQICPNPKEFTNINSCHFSNLVRTHTSKISRTQEIISLGFFVGPVVLQV